MTTMPETKSWGEMSSSERQHARFETWLAGEGIPFESPEAEATSRPASRASATWSS